MPKVVKILFFLIPFILVVLLCFYLLTLPIRSHSQRRGVVEITIELGSTASEIAKTLYKKKLIRNVWDFLIYTRLTGKDRNIKAGHYFIKSGASLAEILETFSAQTSYLPVTVTIPEGSTNYKIAQILSDKDIVSFDLFYQTSVSGQALAEVKDIDKNGVTSSIPKNNGLEGYLFPDTYVFPQSSSATKIFKIMIANLNNKLSQQMLSDIKKSGHTFYEIITMASIIEKETVKANDKGIVSGILWKRYLAHVHLEVDSTLLYILDRSGSELSFSDLKSDTPYNTYKYPGLPPTPIGNPGLESIKATLYPTKSDYWYFLSDKNQNIIYSKNIYEHNINKAKYLD